MIEKRKRMLQSFLNRILNHSKLGSEHVFHRFLESGVSWVKISVHAISSSSIHHRNTEFWNLYFLAAVYSLKFYTHHHCRLFPRTHCMYHLRQEVQVICKEAIALCNHPRPPALVWSQCQVPHTRCEIPILDSLSQRLSPIKLHTIWVPVSIRHSDGSLDA
jgi:hypothetical protein